MSRKKARRPRVGEVWVGPIEHPPEEWAWWLSGPARAIRRITVEVRRVDSRTVTASFALPGRASMGTEPKREYTVTLGVWVRNFRRVADVRGKLERTPGFSRVRNAARQHAVRKGR